jgi:hypothetical protein
VCLNLHWCFENLAYRTSNICQIIKRLWQPCQPFVNLFLMIDKEMVDNPLAYVSSCSSICPHLPIPTLPLALMAGVSFSFWFLVGLSTWVWGAAGGSVAPTVGVVSLGQIDKGMNQYSLCGTNISREDPAGKHQLSSWACRENHRIYRVHK